MGYKYKEVDIPYGQNSREGNAANWAVDAFGNIFGRAPSALELSKVLPSFIGSDPNITDVGAGTAAVASLRAVQEEGDKQSKQIRDLATSESSAREDRLKKLGGILTGQADQLFSSRILPATAEDANAKGIYTGTGFSEALAREKGNLASDVESKLAQEGLSDTDAVLGLNRNALQREQELSTGGLERGFSLSDYANQANTARMVASSLATPGGKTAAQTGGNIATGAGSAAKLYAASKGKGGGTAGGTG